MADHLALLKEIKPEEVFELDDRHLTGSQIKEMRQDLRAGISIRSDFSLDSKLAIPLTSGGFNQTDSVLNNMGSIYRGELNDLPQTAMAYILQAIGELGEDDFQGHMDGVLIAEAFAYRYFKLPRQVVETEVPLTQQEEGVRLGKTYIRKDEVLKGLPAFQSGLEYDQLMERIDSLLLKLEDLAADYDYRKFQRAFSKEGLRKEYPEISFDRAILDAYELGALVRKKRLATGQVNGVNLTNEELARPLDYLHNISKPILSALLESSFGEIIPPKGSEQEWKPYTDAARNLADLDSEHRDRLYKLKATLHNQFKDKEDMINDAYYRVVCDGISYLRRALATELDEISQKRGLDFLEATPQFQELKSQTKAPNLKDPNDMRDYVMESPSLIMRLFKELTPPIADAFVARNADGVHYAAYLLAPETLQERRWEGPIVRAIQLSASDEEQFEELERRLLSQSEIDGIEGFVSGLHIGTVETYVYAETTRVIENRKEFGNWKRYAIAGISFLLPALAGYAAVSHGGGLGALAVGVVVGAALGWGTFKKYTAERVAAINAPVEVEVEPTSDNFPESDMTRQAVRTLIDCKEISNAGGYKPVTYIQMPRPKGSGSNGNRRRRR